MRSILVPCFFLLLLYPLCQSAEKLDDLLIQIHSNEERQQALQKLPAVLRDIALSNPALGEKIPWQKTARTVERTLSQHAPNQGEIEAISALITRCPDKHVHLFTSILATVQHAVLDQ